MAEDPRIRRSADRTREAILESAETLFAQKGYRGTSLADIGNAAGLSRGTPGYFFHTKDELYRTTVERVIERSRVALLPTLERIRDPALSLEAILPSLVEALLELLADEPVLVRLIHWDDVESGTLQQTGGWVDEIRAAIEARLAPSPDAQAEAAAVLLTLLALCWFPFAYSGTLKRVAGIDTGDAAIRAAYQRAASAMVEAKLTIGEGPDRDGSALT